MIHLIVGILIGMAAIGIPSWYIIYKKNREIKYFDQFLLEVEGKVIALNEKQKELRELNSKLRQETQSILNRSNN